MRFHRVLLLAMGMGTRMTRIERIGTDLSTYIRSYPFNPRHPRSYLMFPKQKLYN
jgi:hypothetical protein